MKHLIITVTSAGASVAARLKSELEGCTEMTLREFKDGQFSDADCIIFIGALGICVRTIAPMLADKHTDPAIVCIDSTGRYSIAVASGHVGGANDLCRRTAAILGGEAVITTQSDRTGLWALDTLGREFGWQPDASPSQMREAIYHFVNGRPTALILDIKDGGTQHLERTLPENVSIAGSVEEAETSGAGLIIGVGPMIRKSGVPSLWYRPKVVTLGVGCRRNADPNGAAEEIKKTLAEAGVSPLSVARIATITLKKDERLINAVAKEFGVAVEAFDSETLADIEVPNPSEKVKETVGAGSVAESAAIVASQGGRLVLEKSKHKLHADSDFTMAAAFERGCERGGHIEIVGAGPGDPELVSVRGKRFLQEADLILYAGSLVPRELTFYAKPGCTVRSSASMNLEEQFALMKEFYDRGLLVVRLHTGDPCIYGAIQEQMAFFDRYGMDYHITPGISSFQAAAAALRSQFTIPEKVQTIILTRGEGRTPMPEKEQLHKLAQSQSTMCIYLSAGIVDQVQSELLQAYPPETPVAACYKLTWKEERIYRGRLKDLAKIVKDNNLTLTTLLVVGDAIDNREGLSKLYDRSFSHLFRK